MSHYATAWRNEDGQVQTGRLDMKARAVQFEGGRHRSGRLAVMQLLYRDILDAEMAPTERRVQGRPTVELRSRHGSVYVAPVGAGLARELVALLQRRLELRAS
jgi:hypothetical protein